MASGGTLVTALIISNRLSLSPRLCGSFKLGIYTVYRAVMSPKAGPFFTFDFPLFSFHSVTFDDPFTTFTNTTPKISRWPMYALASSAAVCLSGWVFSYVIITFSTLKHVWSVRLDHWRPWLNRRKSDRVRRCHPSQTHKCVLFSMFYDTKIQLGSLLCRGRRSILDSSNNDLRTIGDSIPLRVSLPDRTLLVRHLILPLQSDWSNHQAPQTSLGVLHDVDRSFHFQPFLRRILPVPALSRRTDFNQKLY